jgi:hypothetical protein
MQEGDVSYIALRLNAKLSFGAHGNKRLNRVMGCLQVNILLLFLMQLVTLLSNKWLYWVILQLKKIFM